MNSISAEKEESTTTVKTKFTLEDAIKLVPEKKTDIFSGKKNLSQSAKARAIMALGGPDGKDTRNAMLSMASDNEKYGLGYNGGMLLMMEPFFTVDFINGFE